MPKISIAIPVYEMCGKGIYFLDRAIKSIIKQDFKDYEIVISDNSTTNEIKEFLEHGLLNNYSYNFHIVYDKIIIDKPNKNTVNLNNAIELCSGEIIKILFQDDRLSKISTLSLIVKQFENINTKWLCTGSVDISANGNIIKQNIPKYNKNIYTGNNTIGCPSCIAYRNLYKDFLSYNLLFDENLKYLMDVDFYQRMYEHFGMPVILPQPLVEISIWDGQVSKVQKDVFEYTRIILQETNYTKNKYQKKD